MLNVCMNHTKTLPSHDCCAEELAAATGDVESIKRLADQVPDLTERIAGMISLWCCMNQHEQERQKRQRLILADTAEALSASMINHVIRMHTQPRYMLPSHIIL